MGGRLFWTKRWVSFWEMGHKPHLNQGNPSILLSKPTKKDTYGQGHLWARTGAPKWWALAGNLAGMQYKKNSPLGWKIIDSP